MFNLKALAGLLLTACLGSLPGIVFAQAAYNLSFNVASYDGTTLLLEALASLSTETRLASSNLVFTYDPTTFTAPTYVAGSSQLGPAGAYFVGVTQPQTGRASINIVQAIEEVGTPLTTTPIVVATIRFSALDPSGPQDIDWLVDGTRATVVFQDDPGATAPATSGTTRLAPGTLTGLSSVPLPVELTGFWGKVRQTAGPTRVDLTWQTSSEQSSAYFDVEHSTDGLGFEDFTRVAAAAGSNVVTDYATVHLDAQTGVNYYRLRQVDLDGASTLSEVIAVEVRGAMSPASSVLLAWPNPTSDVLHLRPTSEDHGRLQLWDVRGQLVARWDYVPAAALHLGHLPVGTYHLELLTDGNGVERTTIVKH